jgi:GTP-binding protein HflX
MTIEQEQAMTSRPSPDEEGRRPSVSGDGRDVAVEDRGLLDLEDRYALRRVAGLSTELADVTEVEYRQLRLERVVLVGVWTRGSAEDATRSLTELAALAETAGSQVLDALLQRRSNPDPATYIGSGKVGEVRDAVQDSGADTVICDGELTPAQLRNLEDRIGVKVVDRTILILDIFAQHARTREGKAQVELAQLHYLTQRLRGWGGQLSRQAGGRAGAGGVGIGGRGPGETKIETDRRRIQQRITRLRRELDQMHATRRTTRAQRRRHEVPAIAIVGYTNAGKSSLLNRLTGSDVLVEDALFATLDPTVRRSQTDDGRVFTLSDTVGFVRHLPHQIVEAFRSTLEEVSDADVLLHVVDASDPDPEGQVRAVRDVLAEIGAGDLVEVVAVNKVDQADPEVVARLLRRERFAVAVSARTGAGMSALRRLLAEQLPRPSETVDLVLPYTRGDLVARVHETGDVLAIDHGAVGTRLQARVTPDLAAALRAASNGHQHAQSDATPG